MSYRWKLFALRIFTRSYICLLGIIIGYLKPYDWTQRKDNHQIEVISGNYILLLDRPICIMFIVFPNGPWNRGSIPGRHTKDSKMVLDASLLNTQSYKVSIRSKWSNPVKEVAPSLTPQRSSYWKGSFRVALDYGQLTYNLIYY